MKKITILFFFSMALVGCSTITHMPNAQNNFGIQTQVVLNQANYRIVKNVEVVVDATSESFKKSDMEKTAYSELLRQYPLEGSQAYINVIVEELRHDMMGPFRHAFADIPRRKQYFTARATIIEFLQENGEPIHSVMPLNPSVYGITNEADLPQQTIEPEKRDTIISIEEVVETKIEYAHDFQSRLEPLEAQADNTYEQYKNWNLLNSVFYESYHQVYTYLHDNPTELNLSNLESIQIFVNKIVSGASSKKIERELSNATTTNQKIRIFISYAQN